MTSSTMLTNFLVFDGFDVFRWFRCFSMFFDVFRCFSMFFDVFRCFSMYFDVFDVLHVSGTAAPAPPARRKSVARRAFNFLDKKLVAGGDEDDDDADVLIVNARRGMLMKEGTKEGRKEGRTARSCFPCFICLHVLLSASTC
jgi:hypothetical protein